MAFCSVLPSQSERFTKDSNVIAGKLANDLDSKLTSSSKQVLLQRIEFKAASKPDEQYEKLKSKYKALNQSSVLHVNGKTDKNCNQVNHIKKEDDFPEPNVILCNPDKIMLQWNKVRRIGPGLSNLGNTCYLNSVIQVLTYTAPLVNFLSTQEHTRECRAVGFCMMCELQRHVLRSFNHHQNESIKPLAIIQKLRSIAKHLRFGHQEDAHEFLRYVIDGMQKSCLHGHERLDKASKETTVIHKIFSGYYRSQVRCLMCHYTSNTFDPLMEVMLDIKQAPTILRALQRLCKAELLDGDNLYHCLKCKKKVPANKQVLIHRPPNILTIQLKRFDSNHIFGGKVTKPVEYKEHLDLRPFMTTPKGPPVRYRLYAVLVHSGYSSNSGHYYCYVRSSNNSWYNMNDSTVRQVGLNAVLSQQAYLLFYSKVLDNSSQPEKKPFSPVTLKPSSNSPAQPLPKIIKENDFGTPVNRNNNGLNRSKFPSTLTDNKAKPSTSSHPSPTVIPADQRPKLSFTLKSPTKFGKVKPEQRTSQDAKIKEDSPKKHIGEQQTTTEKNTTKKTVPSDSSSKVVDSAKISKDSATEEKSTNSHNVKAPEPVDVSFPVKKDEKICTPKKSVRPPPLFIPRSVQAKNCPNDTKSNENKEVSMTSPAQATTPWKVTPTTHFSMMSSPNKGSLFPQPSPSSLVSDGSSSSSVTAKTGEWAVQDKNIPTPGPVLPERQHAGWTVSEKSGTETTDKNEDRIEETNNTHKKSKKKRKKEKRKKGNMKYDKLEESTSEVAETIVNEENEDCSKKNKNKHKQKKKRKKEKKRKDSEREELLKKKYSEEDQSSTKKKPKKRKETDNHEVETKKQKLVAYSCSNDSSESGDDLNNNAKQEKHKYTEKEPSKNSKKAVPVILFSGNPQDKQSHKATWDGSRDSRVVNELLNKGGGVFGYGNNVSTWEGGDSLVNNADQNERKRKHSLDCWDEELDKGKVKKVKDKNKQEKLSSGTNFFQREQDRKNKKGDRLTSHFSRRSSSHRSRSHSSRGYHRF